MAYVIFPTPVGWRLYDREKNKIISLREEEQGALQAFHCGTPMKGLQKAIIDRLKAAGYCLEGALETIENPVTTELEAELSQKMTNLLLQVTQNCNLRCEYCAYSGNYYNRVHNSLRMSEETALQAVDYFMARSGVVERPIVGFYGGEPFLEFELIKKVVAYIEEMYPDRNCGFNLTTNLTLFNDEIIKFVVDHDFDVMISIDGPKPVQDRYRIFANGKGSFDTVIDKARKLRDIAPEFFIKCSTNTVVSPHTDYREVVRFFDHDEIFGSISSRISLITDAGIKEKIVYDDSFYCLQNREILKLYLSMLGELDEKKVSGLHREQQSTLKTSYTRLKSAGLDGVKTSHPGGPCIPGVKKLFVDVHGNFYPCEKVSEQEIFQIGNLRDGIDKNRAANFLNVGKYTEEECKSCWAFSVCTTCAVSMVEGKELSREKRLQKCKEVRSSVLSTWQDIETLKYYGYDFEEEGKV